MGDDVDINTLTIEQYLALIQDNNRPGIVKPKIGNDVKFEININFMRELRRKLFAGTDDEDAHKHVRRVLEIVDIFHFLDVTYDAVMLRDEAVEQSKYMRSLEETIIKLCEESIKKHDADDEWIRKSIENTKSNIRVLKTTTKNLQEKAYQLTQTVLIDTGEKVKARTTMGKESEKGPVPHNLPVVQTYASSIPFLGHLKEQIVSPYKTHKTVCMIENPGEVHKLKAQEDEGDMYVGWDIIVEDIERLRKFIIPTIHTLPNLEPVVKPYMSLGPFHDKEKIIREVEQDYDIPLHDGVIQPLAPQIVYVTPHDDDYVAPTTSPTLDMQLNEFGKECFDITRVSEMANSNPVKDKKELSDIIKTSDFETFIQKLLHQISQSSHETSKIKRKMKSHQWNGTNLSFPYQVFSQHLSDDEASNHEDASDTGAALHNNKVIQNGNSNKRISTGKDGGFEYIPQKHMRRFHGMDDAKEIWEAIRTRFGGNANSKKMQKALEAHGAEVSTEDANHKFLRSLPPAWSNLAMTMRTKPDVDTLSIDDLYNNLRVFEQEIQGASKTFSSAQNVAFVSQSKSSTNKVKSGFTGAYSTCTPSTSSTNIPEKEALAGFADEKLECFNCHNTGHFARECTAKGTHDGKKKRDSFYQHQEAGKQEKNQMGLLTMDDGIVNWGEHTKDEETNHALMAISSSSEVSLCSKTCIDSYNTLKTLCDEQMNQLGDQEAQILAYRQAVTKLEAQLCKIGLEKDSVGKPLYSRFTKTNDFKGVPHLLSGDYTLNHKKKLMSPRCMFMIKRDPKSLKPSVSDDRSSEYSTCQSNDSAGSIRTSSVHSVDLESKISRVPQEVYVSKHTTTQMKKGKYSSTKKKCFVCGSLCHLIKDCDYYEKKMAREAGFKKQRVFNTGNMVAKPVWTNDDRINHDNQFVPRLVQLNAGRPNINSVRPNINTDLAKNTAQMSHSHAVKGNWGSAVKTSAGIAWICSCKEVLISLCLRKPDESAGFAEIVDFLRGSNLRYALTTNPTIYDSLVKQFGRCYMPKLLADGLLELKQLLDTIVGQEALSITQPQPSSRVVPPTPPITQPIPSEATTILPLSQPAPLIPIAETTTASPSPTPSPCPT
ncbi:zf-CCHC domain-containing protein [Tanacetum coccineum]